MTQAIRVLNVIGGLDPTAGGPPSSAQNIWLAAARAGVAVSAALPINAPKTAGEAIIIAKLRRAGITIHEFPFTKGPYKFVRWGVSLRLAWWLLREARNYDVVHGHSAWMFSSLVALAVAQLYGKAYVLMPHESVTPMDLGKSRRLKSALKAAIKRIYLRQADAVIVASQLEQRDSVPSGAAVACHALLHPVLDEAEARPVTRVWPAQLDRLRLGYLGRFDPKKNIELIFRAVAVLPASSLSVAGGGSERYTAALRYLADELGIANRVRWCGFISAAERAEFFAAIDVLVMPSVYECYGMVAAEALTQGVPVIVSDTTGIAELVDRWQCGCVVAPNEAALVDALARLQREPAMLTRMSARAAEAVGNELTFAGYGPRLATIYAELVARHGGQLPDAAAARLGRAR